MAWRLKTPEPAGTRSGSSDALLDEAAGSLEAELPQDGLVARIPPHRVERGRSDQDGNLGADVVGFDLPLEKREHAAASRRRRAGEPADGASALRAGT